MIDGTKRTAIGRCRWLAKLALLLGLLPIAGVVIAASSDTAPDYSEANRLLFMTDHLADVQTPARLHYRFERTAADDESSYDDTIDLDVNNGTGDGKQVQVDFFSGDRHRFTPTIDNAHGNPVIMMFLQNDVTAIAERTGGSWRYFQRRVKFALADGATVVDDTMAYDGREIAVKRITMQPFTGETRHREALGPAVDKRYVLTLSDAVPGGVLELRSEVPSVDDSSTDTPTAAISERLALESVTHADAPTAGNDAT